MSPANTNHQKGRSRVSNACQRCRKHKIKCSGSIPCRTCDRRGYNCEYAADERKVVIAESTLRDLQKRSQELEQLRNRRSSRAPSQASAHDYPSSSSHPEDETTLLNEGTASNLGRYHDYADRSTEGIDSHQEENAAQFSNPLVPEQPGYVQDSNGRLLYFGHSSTWAFTQQLLFKTNQTSHTQHTLDKEASVYALNTKRVSIEQDDTKGLPSFESAMFYMQTVKFRTWPLYYLFDEGDFVFHLRRFYSNVPEYAQQHQIWFVHYLVVMAFGKTFNTSHNAVTAGLTLFSRALRLLPDTTILCRDPVPSTELLSSIALYLQSVDYRAAAHLYIGQALRMAYSHGLHTDMRTASVTLDLAIRGARIWWTVYALDRRLGSTFGVPPGVRDEDMTTPLPAMLDQSAEANAHDIHVRICQVLGRVVTTVYSNEETFKRVFLSTVQGVLRGAASLIDELSRFSAQCAGEISRVVSHLNLCYHQCIIVASRPFLFHLLSRRWESTNPKQGLRLSSAVKGILQVCIDSAAQSVGILTQLKDHDLLDIFLPFDLESAFSSALVLVIASALYPKLLPQNDWLDACYNIFDHMKDKGNAIANLRKSEVEQLAQIRVRTQTGQQHHDPSSCVKDRQPAAVVGDQGLIAQPTPTTAMTELSQPSLPSLNPFFDEWLMDVGFNETQMMDLANSLNPEDMVF